MNKGYNELVGTGVLMLITIYGMSVDNWLHGFVIGLLWVIYALTLLVMSLVRLRFDGYVSFAILVCDMVIANTVINSENMALGWFIIAVSILQYLRS